MLYEVITPATESPETARPRHRRPAAVDPAKQVIVQKVREAEREIVISEYKDRVGELVAGVITSYSIHYTKLYES